MAPESTSERRVALITGSRRGIGAAIARHLASQGLDIVLHGRAAEGPSAAKAEALRTELEGLGARVASVGGDIARKDEVGAFMEAAQEAFGRLDVLVLNAARAPFKESWRLLERDLRQLVDTNLLGNVFCLQKALPLLREAGQRPDGAHVAFLSSLGSRFMNVQYPLGPVKAAMESMVRQWSEELRDEGIHVNGVCGGLVKTDAYKTLRRIWPELASLPERFFVTPEEIARVVGFLVSDAAGGVAGQNIVVDRGLSNRVLRWP